MCVLSVLNMFKGASNYFASCFAQKSFFMIYTAQLSPLLCINKEVCFPRQGAV